MKIPDPIPTREQINPDDTLDGQVAAQHFFGKDLKAAEKMFRDGRDYTEDLEHMGTVAFRYYVQAAIQYLRSPTATRGMLSGFYCALKSHSEYEIEELAPIASELASICEYLIEHHDRLSNIPPMSAEEHRKFVDLLREHFDKTKAEIGSCQDLENPEDFIDLRPKLAELQKHFLSIGLPPRWVAPNAV